MKWIKLHHEPSCNSALQAFSSFDEKIFLELFSFLQYWLRKFWVQIPLKKDNLLLEQYIAQDKMAAKDKRIYNREYFLVMKIQIFPNKIEIITQLPKFIFWCIFSIWLWVSGKRQVDYKTINSWIGQSGFHPTSSCSQGSHFRPNTPKTGKPMMHTCNHKFH